MIVCTHALESPAVPGRLTRGRRCTAEATAQLRIHSIDDLGWRDLGVQGSSFYETPNIDRLASQGMRFTNAYAACPVCSPTRASILTGRYPVHTGITDWIPGWTQWPQAKLRPAPTPKQLPLNEVTLAEALKPLGYRSASMILAIRAGL
jgi:arylsulfatase A